MDDRQTKRDFLAIIDARLALVVFVRVLAILYMISGLERWATILGPLAPNGDFLSLPTDHLVATVFFAVADLVAAVGLWLLASWGTVVWLISALTEVVLQLFFDASFAYDPAVLAFHCATVIVYAVLTWLVERSRQNT